MQAAFTRRNQSINSAWILGEIYHSYSIKDTTMYELQLDPPKVEKNREWSLFGGK